MSSRTKFLLIAMLLCLGFSGHSETIEDYQTRIESSHSQLTEIDKQIKQAEQQRQRLMQQLKANEKGSQDRTRRVKELENDVQDYELRLSEFEATVSNLQAELDIDRNELADMLRSSQKTTRHSGLKVMLSHQSPELSRRLGVYLDYVMIAQQARIDFHSEKITTVEAAKREALKSRNWLQHIQGKAKRQKLAYKEKTHSSRSALENIDSTVTSNKVRQKALIEEKQRLQLLMEELEAAEGNQSGYFEASKGQHSWPIKPSGTKTLGQMLQAKFGDKRKSGKLTWNGLLFKATAGDTVSAIADGTVVYAAPLAGMGTLVVISHGDGFMSLYGGNRQSLVKSGDWAETGATIATVGKASGPNPEGVYLEIRQKAVALNPESWLDSKNSNIVAKK